MSQHQPGMRLQHGNVVGYGAGVGRTGADVNHGDAARLRAPEGQALITILYD